MRIIRILPAPAKKGHRQRTNLLLFAATLATVITAGYLSSSSEVLRFVAPSLNVPGAVALYVLGIFTIFGLHEFGHKLAARRHGINASNPYFIPGLPETGGTFGALILQDSPPVNRDALFDLGVSGPLVGLVVTIPVIAMGLILSIPVSPALFDTVNATFPNRVSDLQTPILFNILESIFVRIPSDWRLFIHPVAFAGWLGLLVTFLNTLPVAQLDGGHIFRAALSERWHRIASYVGLLVLILSGFFFFAILVALLFMRSKHPGPLDDVSRLSKSRIVVLAVFPVIWILAFPMTSIFG